MTDLLTRIIACDGNPQETAELILEAWLADNPEPGEGRPSRAWTKWNICKAFLRRRLLDRDPGALLGAVIDFILPEGWEWQAGRFADGNGTAEIWIGDQPYSSEATTPALALLAACIKVRETSHE